MTHKSQLEDPFYKNWVKGGLASKYLKEGIEQMINNAIVNIQRQFLSDICNHLSLTDAKCTVCTTANCLPCQTKGRDRKCSFHVKGDPFKEYRKCPNDICDSLLTKISSQHRYGRPVWQNTDATKWCTDHWEIAKCFLPGSGYSDKTSVEDTDCSGLLNLAINCLDIQTHLYLYLAPPHGIFSQILNFRNKIFHSASLILTTEELEENIDLMIRVLQDKKELEQDPSAKTAVLKLEQLKDEGFFISTKDEEEIRQESIVKFQQEIKDDYLGRKQELQDSLCQMYEEHFKTIPLSPLLEDEEAEIDDVFVELVLCDDSIYNKDSEENSRHNGRIIKNYKDVLYNDKDKCKNIYVIGDAGMGKSTWCMKMLRNWVSAQKNNQNLHNKEPDRNSKPEELAQLGINDGQRKPEKIDIFTDEKKQQYNQNLDQARSTFKVSIQKNVKINNLNQEQNTKVECLNFDENVMAEFDIVLFVALRHAAEDGDIRDMVRNQLFQENTYLDDLTTEVLKKEPDKCLIIVDGLDEWTCPANVRCSSLLQHPSLPGRKCLNGCPILTTTRPWKLNVIRLQSKDIDKTLKIQGIENTGLLAEKLINCKNKMSNPNATNHEKVFEMFENEVRNVFKMNNFIFDWNYDFPFLRVPLILIFMVCSWYDNGHLEKTMAGNFNGFMTCLFSVAERGKYSRKKGRLLDMEGFESLKQEWSMCCKYLPRSLQEIEQFSSYSQLLIKLGKLAFESLFTSNNECLVFTESQIRSKLTIKELDVAVKVGILSQSKVVGKTLTRMSSLSFLHKTIQEYLAAVYLCSSADGHKEAIETYANCCVRNTHSAENVRKFVKGLNVSSLNELCKYFAKNDVLSGNGIFQNVSEWTIENKDEITSQSNSFALYGAVLSGTEQQTLEMKRSDILDICKMIPDHYKEDDDIIDIENTLTWCPQSPALSSDQLRTVQLLRVCELRKKSTYETELCKIDLSHCKHLEEVSFKQMDFVKIILNYATFTDIILEDISRSIIHVIKTATRVDSHVKQVENMHMSDLQFCKLCLPAVFWEIDMLSVINCRDSTIDIDPDLDTSLATGHVINTVLYYKKHNEMHSFKIELGNEVKIDTLILRSRRFAQNVNEQNPFFAYLPSNLIVEYPPNCMLTSKSLCQIAQNTSLTRLMLKSNLPDYAVVAKCIRNMKQLVKLHIDLTCTRDGTIEILRALQSLPRLEDIGLIMYTDTKDIVAKYLNCMTQLKRVKLCLEYQSFDRLPEEHVACSTSIFKLSNIEQLEMTCTCYKIADGNLDNNNNCSYKQILLHSVPYLCKLKHLRCGLDFTKCVEALAICLPKMVDLETLCLTTELEGLEEVFHSLKHLTKLKHLKCILQHEHEIQALSKSVLTMTDLEKLDITLKHPDKRILYSTQVLPYHTRLEDQKKPLDITLKSHLSCLQDIPQLTHFKCDRELHQDTMTALLKSITKMVNLETLSVELDCENQSLNESFGEMFSLNEHLQFVTVTDISITGYGVMASSLYTAKYRTSYTLPAKHGDKFTYYDRDDDSSVIKIGPYWELKRKQENISNI